MATPAPKDTVRRLVRAVNRQDFDALADLRGKIAEVWGEWDQLAFLTKLGHLAPMTGDWSERPS